MFQARVHQATAFTVGMQRHVKTVQADGYISRRYEFGSGSRIAADCQQETGGCAGAGITHFGIPVKVDAPHDDSLII